MSRVCAGMQSLHLQYVFGSSLVDSSMQDAWNNFPQSRHFHANSSLTLSQQATYRTSIITRTKSYLFFCGYLLLLCCCKRFSCLLFLLNAPLPATCCYCSLACSLLALIQQRMNCLLQLFNYDYVV
jgi:hypothetical protein